MQGVEEEGKGENVQDLSSQRDALIVGMLQATKPLRKT